MKKVMILTALLLFVSMNSIAFDNTDKINKMLPAGMKISAETIEAKILKIYAAEDNGAKFRAYVVNWKGTEVIVSDPLGTTNKNEGDSITFMAQRMEMPRDNNIKTLHFMIMDFGAFMKNK